MLPDFEVKKEGTNKSFLRWASYATALLGVLAFWGGGGMLMAALRYPSEYDWRYMPVSNLLSPSRNPTGYLWASMGIVLCGLCGLCWAAVLAQRWNLEGARIPAKRNQGSSVRKLLHDLCRCAAPVAAPDTKSYQVLIR
jgi:hypothetical protein